MQFIAEGMPSAGSCHALMSILLMACGIVTVGNDHCDNASLGEG